MYHGDNIIVMHNNVLEASARALREREKELRVSEQKGTEIKKPRERKKQSGGVSKDPRHMPLKDKAREELS